MAAVILSATVFGDQYLKHPMILLAFIWRIHRHTTGMSHKHVEPFFKDRGGGGMRGGGRRGGVSGANWAQYPTLLSSGLLQVGGKRRGASQVPFPPFFTLSGPVVLWLNTGLPCAEWLTH